MLEKNNELRDNQNRGKIFHSVLIFPILMGFLLLSCAKPSVIGQSIWDLKSKHPNYSDFISLTVFQMDDDILITVHNGSIVTKTVTFSLDRKYSELYGMTLLADPDLDLVKGMSLVEIEKQFGKFHVDMGSGFNIPAYITETGYLLSFHNGNHEFLEIRKLDLLSQEKPNWNSAEIIAYDIYTPYYIISW